jgi:hypothetical protein
MVLSRLWWQRGSVARRVALIGIGWLALAVATMVIATQVLNLIDDGLARSSASPLTRAEVARELEGHRTPAPRVSPSTAASVAPVPAGTPASSRPIKSPTAAATGTSSRTSTKTLASAGGTVVARCTGDLAELLSWSPSQGYLVTSVSRGPGAAATVKFRTSATKAAGEEDDELAWIITVTCFNGVPQATTTKSGDD